MGRKPILCLDFDGVIHSYASGWKGADVIPDPPVAGALEFIRDAVEHFEVHIYSSRSGQEGGISAMQDWMIKHYGDDEYGTFVLDVLCWPDEKPAAMVSIDDRAITFDGTWPLMEDLLSFKPWNKKPTGATGTYPQGKLNEDDEGGLNIAIGIKDGVVVIDFGKPVAWLGLDPETAEVVAKSLMRRAQQLRN